MHSPLKDECQLRAERLFARLTQLRAELLGERVNASSIESVAQIGRIAAFLRGSSSVDAREFVSRSRRQFGAGK